LAKFCTGLRYSGQLNAIFVNKTHTSINNCGRDKEEIEGDSEWRDPGGRDSGGRRGEWIKDSE
jgi:hypothetical protein